MELVEYCQKNGIAVEAYSPIAHGEILNQPEIKAIADKYNGVKVNVMSAIDIMVESLKRIILDASTEKLKLPMILPVESMEGITE